MRRFQAFLLTLPGACFPERRMPIRAWPSILSATFATIPYEKKGFLFERTFLKSFSISRYFFAIMIYGLATETLSETSECHDTCISSSHIVVLTFSTDIFKSVWVAHSEDVTTFTAASTENLLSVDSRLTREKSVNTETFSFFKFSDHSEKNEMDNREFPLFSSRII